MKINRLPAIRGGYLRLKAEQILKVICAPISAHPALYLYILLLNLISNYSVTIWHTKLGAIVGIFFLSAFIAYAELAVYNILPKYIKSIYFWALIIVQNILLITDWFLVFNFQTLICPETIDILRETNLNETKGFLSTYLTPTNAIIGCGIVFSFNLIIYYLSKIISRYNILRITLLCFSICGFLYLGYGAFNFVLYKQGKAIPQYSSITRSAHSFMVSNHRKLSSLEVLDICKNISAINSNSMQQSPTIIVVIGESFSYQHSSSYGYKYKTNKNLDNRFSAGELIIFNDVVSVSDHTHPVMKSVFSLSDTETDFGRYPLFPACFKAAGYQSVLYDNQYFVNQGEQTFLTNADVSNVMFSARNANGYAFDGNLVAAMNPVDSNSLCIIHLMGQHYNYEDRYPKEFKHFTADDYDKSKYTDRQREFIAHYDNATLYNDYVIDQIIRKHEDKNCILIYFSDHGEEVFECRDYMGHGNAAHSPNIDLQIKVPFMIWASDKYQQNYPDKMERIKRAINFPITTNDIGHFLLDLADIRTEWLDYSRSFISDQYDTTRHRIVLNSIDYDAIK
ncbi:MAG: phosphoethanolamine transferase [Rikenellaceae bacterium]|nr:phosphoethanolamine transferase [Rikenellaceae bacterium]